MKQRAEREVRADMPQEMEIEEIRSGNGQREYLLAEAVRKRKKDNQR